MKAETIKQLEDISLAILLPKDSLLGVYEAIENRGFCGMMELRELTSFGVPILSKLAILTDTDIEAYCRRIFHDTDAVNPLQFSIEDFEAVICSIANKKEHFKRYDMREIRKKTIIGKLER